MCTLSKTLPETFCILINDLFFLVLHIVDLEDVKTLTGLVFSAYPAYPAGCAAVCQAKLGRCKSHIRRSLRVKKET